MRGLPQLFGDTGKAMLGQEPPCWILESLVYSTRYCPICSEARLSIHHYGARFKHYLMHGIALTNLVENEIILYKIIFVTGKTNISTIRTENYIVLSKYCRALDRRKPKFTLNTV